MRLFISLLIVSSLSLIVYSKSIEELPAEDAKELKLVHVVMRHGIRTPVDTYPKDPFIQHDFAPNGWGQLTKGGISDLHEFGHYLREKYGKFLGSHFSSSKFYAQATGVDRAIASIMSVNSGLWQPVDKEQKAIHDLDWFPVPVNSEPLDTDMLLLVRKDCPEYNLELQKVENSAEIQNKLKDNEELFKYVQDATGKDIKNFYDIEDVYTTLLAEKSYGLKLPSWTDGYFPEKMSGPASLSFVLKAYNDKLQRLKGGVLLKKILNDWTNKATNNLKPADRKFFLYGGHDTTISNLLSALKVFDPQVPNYAIAIIMELKEDKKTGQHGIEISLRNSTTVAPYKLQIPGCELFCPLTKLTELTKNVIPKDWEIECKTDDPNYTEAPQTGP